MTGRTRRPRASSRAGSSGHLGSASVETTSPELEVTHADVWDASTRVNPPAGTAETAEQDAPAEKERPATVPDLPVTNAARPASPGLPAPETRAAPPGLPPPSRTVAPSSDGPGLLEGSSVSFDDLTPEAATLAPPRALSTYPIEEHPGVLSDGVLSSPSVEIPPEVEVLPEVEEPTGDPIPLEALSDWEDDAVPMRIRLHHPSVGETAFTIEEGGQVVLGRRGGTAGLELNWDGLISRRHALVRVKNGEVWFEDLGSRHGSWWGGQRLDRPVRLEVGDTIQLGDTMLTLAPEDGSDNTWETATTWARDRDDVLDRIAYAHTKDELAAGLMAPARNASVAPPPSGYVEVDPISNEIELDSLLETEGPPTEGLEGLSGELQPFDRLETNENVPALPPEGGTMADPNLAAEAGTAAEPRLSGPLAGGDPQWAVAAEAGTVADPKLTAEAGTMAETRGLESEPQSGIQARWVESRQVELAAVSKEDFKTLWAEELQRGGVFVATESPPGFGTTVVLRLTSPDGEVRLRSRVVHVAEPGPRSIGGMSPGVGLQVVELKDDLREQIEAYLDGRVETLRAMDAPEPAGPSGEDILAEARALVKRAEGGELYRALSVPVDASDDALKERLTELKSMFDEPPPGLGPPQVARLKAASKLLDRIELVFKKGRLDYDFSQGIVRAETRIAEANTGRGPSIETLQSAWARAHPDRADEARTLMKRAETARRQRNFQEAVDAARGALKVHPFLIDLYEKIDFWENLVAGGL